MTVRVEWLGHAAVLVEGSGARVLFDPYESGGFGGRIAHAPLDESVDVVVLSHFHADHAYVRAARGAPRIVDGPARIGSLRFRTVPAYHDRMRGARMGLVRMTTLTLEGLTVAHLGDLGVPPERDQVQRLGRPDLVFVPVGGTYTLDAAAAAETIARLGPRIAVPIHFATERCLLDLAPLAPFLDEARSRGWPVDVVGGAELLLRPPLPSPTRIAVLRPSR